MNAALFRITLRQTKKRPLSLSRSVSEECLDSAVLCAQQWCVWSNAAGRGKRPKFNQYRVDSLGDNGLWCEVATGNLADARRGWTEEDDARIEQGTMVRPLIGVQGTTRHGKARTLRGASRPKSRLAALVAEIQQRK